MICRLVPRQMAKSASRACSSASRGRGHRWSSHGSSLWQLAEWCRATTLCSLCSASRREVVACKAHACQLPQQAAMHKVVRHGLHRALQMLEVVQCSAHIICLPAHPTAPAHLPAARLPSPGCGPAAQPRTRAAAVGSSSRGKWDPRTPSCRQDLVHPALQIERLSLSCPSASWRASAHTPGCSAAPCA